MQAWWGHAYPNRPHTHAVCNGSAPRDGGSGGSAEIDPSGDHGLIHLLCQAGIVLRTV